MLETGIVTGDKGTFSAFKGPGVRGKCCDAERPAHWDEARNRDNFEGHSEEEV